MIPGRTFHLEQLHIYHTIPGLWIAGDERNLQYGCTIAYPKLLEPDVLWNSDFFGL
jgi:hypothetical protein